MKQTTHLHLVLRSRMCGTILPLPQYASWNGARLKKKVEGRAPLRLRLFESKMLRRILDIRQMN